MFKWLTGKEKKEDRHFQDFLFFCEQLGKRKTSFVSVDFQLEDMKKNDEIKKMLFDKIEEYPGLSNLLQKYNVSIGEVEIIYDTIIAGGGGQWVGGGYVPVSAVFLPFHLDFLLGVYNVAEKEISIIDWKRLIVELLNISEGRKINYKFDKFLL
jgi:hypothetical protein